MHLLKIHHDQNRLYITKNCARGTGPNFGQWKLELQLQLKFSLKQNLWSEWNETVDDRSPQEGNPERQVNVY